MFKGQEKSLQSDMVFSLNYLIQEIKENFSEKEVLKTVQDFFPNIVLFDIDKENTTHHSLPLGYVYNWKTKILLYKNKQIRLAKKEILLLELLLKNPSRIVTYNELENHLWSDSVMTENSIRSLVKNLRKKIPSNFIENLSGVGYKIA